ncbi:MAG TPA: glycosyltransferase family 39 protein, partial [Candidatus Sabulitectum sp.]|nr:glycosyltransferase family 39 protein [Candidatus Sabulitectum sp.]
RFFAAAVLIMLFALGVRSIAMLRNPIPAGDGISSNMLLADNLNRGLGYTTFVKWTLYDKSEEFLRPEANRQPATATLLAGWFRLLGTGYFQAQLLAMAMGALAMLAAASWTARTFGRGAALAVLAYLAADPPFVWFSVHMDSLMAYVTLFYLILILADCERLSMQRTILLGVLTGLLYLVRTQGVLMVPALVVWIIFKERRRWLWKALAFGLAALVVVSPWLIRNISEFGNPSHSQNGQFILNENHWSAWSIRDSAPSPSDMWRNQGPAAVARYVAAGVLRVFEPFTTGSTHRGEIFGQPTLAVFAAFAVFALVCPQTRRKMLLPGLALVPVFLALVLHQHSGRYLSVAVPAVVAAGSAGIGRLASTAGKKIIPWLALLIALTLARPLLQVLEEDSRERAAETMEVALWVKENASDSAWVCTFPNVELFTWVYRKPTLAWPNDYEMLLWPYLHQHGVEYMVVDPDLPVLRPWLSRCWRRSPDGREWDLINPPPFLEEVWRSQSGKTLVYRFSGEVPRGYMAVDSLPPDNYR